MASKSSNGNSPLGGTRINGNKGLQSAIGQLSNDIGKRTPKQSMTAGSLQVHNGVFHVPKKARNRSTATSAILSLVIVQGTEASKFQVTTGTVNTQTPTLGGVAINSPVSPATTPETPEITVTADIWVYIKVVGTFGDPDTYVITIETETSVTPPTGTDITADGFTSFFYIGKVDFTSGSPDTFAITNSHTGGNVNVESFGNVNLWWKV